MINKSMKRSGFTLIELLVVISIVAILSALLMANFIGVRQRSRDATRKSDLQNLRQALELYRADTGSYPASITCGTSLTNPDDATVIYMQEIPCDPISSSSQTEYQYSFNAATNTYTVQACLENSADADNEINCQTSGSDACCSTPFNGKQILTNP